MFTGIVQGVARIQEIGDLEDIRRFTVRFPSGETQGLRVGASISIAGVCLTVTSFDGDFARFDVIPESLARTTLGDLQVGDGVNYERAATFGSEIGGHLLSGHISDTVEVVARENSAHACGLTIRASESLMAFILPKGFVALDGCSLTIGTVDVVACRFQVHLIPETLRVTTLKAIGVGSRLNLEVDAMTQAVVETVQRVLASRTEPG